jgi:hypothetical protein
MAFCEAAKVTIAALQPRLHLPGVTCCELRIVVQHLKVLQQQVSSEGLDKGEEVGQVLLLLVVLLQLTAVKEREMFWVDGAKDLLVVLIALVEEHRQDQGKGSQSVTLNSTNSSSSSGSGPGSEGVVGVKKDCNSSSSSCREGIRATYQQHQQQESGDIAGQSDQLAEVHGPNAGTKLTTTGSRSTKIDKHNPQTSSSKSSGSREGINSNTTSTNINRLMETLQEEEDDEFSRSLVMRSWGVAALDLQKGLGDFDTVVEAAFQQQQSAGGTSSSARGSSDAEGDGVDVQMMTLPGAVTMVLSCLLLQPCPYAQRAVQAAALGVGEGDTEVEGGGSRGSGGGREGQGAGGEGCGEVDKQFAVQDGQVPEQLPEGKTAVFKIGGEPGDGRLNGRACHGAYVVSVYPKKDPRMLQLLHTTLI